MTEWHKVTLDEVPALQDEIVSVVEQESAYGRQAPDWDEVLDKIEAAEPGRDLGTDKTDPAVCEILRRARKVYRELKES